MNDGGESPINSCVCRLLLLEMKLGLGIDDELMIVIVTHRLVKSLCSVELVIRSNLCRPLHARIFTMRGETTSTTP